MVTGPTRNARFGTALRISAAATLVMAACGSDPSGPAELPGPGAVLPRETPFSDARQLDLTEATGLVAYPIYRPDHPLARDEDVTDVWVQVPAPDEDASTQVALWYASGLEIHLSPVSPNDTDPLAADFPEGFPVSYETIGGTDAPVITPGVQGPDQPGSVTMVKEGLLISLFGWLPDLTVDELRDIASTVTEPSAS